MPGGLGYGNGTGAGGGIWNEIGAALPFTKSQVITIDVIIGIGNICLLITLLYLYLGSYRKFKSKFTLGLLLFALLLLLQNVLFTSFLLTHQSFRGPGMGVPLFILNIIEFFALLILTWVTLE